MGSYAEWRSNRIPLIRKQYHFGVYNYNRRVDQAGLWFCINYQLISPLVFRQDLLYKDQVKGFLAYITYQSFVNTSPPLISLCSYLYLVIYLN